MDKQLLTIAEVCELTRLGRTRVYDELRTGRLRSIKVGRRRLVPDAAISEWIDSLPAGYDQ